MHVLHWTMWFLLCFELCHLIYRRRCLKITFQLRTCCLSRLVRGDFFVFYFFSFLQCLSFASAFLFSIWTNLKVTLQYDFHKFMLATSYTLRFMARSNNSPSNAFDVSIGLFRFACKLLRQIYEKCSTFFLYQINLYEEFIEMCANSNSLAFI